MSAARAPATLHLARVETPLGPLVLFAQDGLLCGLGFTEHEASLVRWLERRFGSLELKEEADPAGAAAALAAYFAGDLTAIDKVPVDTGGTPFQKRVWTALRQIPAGKTLSYSELALLVAAPKAVRAVGLANGTNPVAIVVPCHRVIASDGTLCGYGGGLDRKRFLLNHEKGVRAHVAREPRQSALSFPPR